MNPSDVFLTLARHVLLRQLALTDPAALEGAIQPAIVDMAEAWGQDIQVAKRAVAYAAASVLPDNASPASLIERAGFSPRGLFDDDPEALQPRVIAFRPRGGDRE